MDLIYSEIYVVWPQWVACKVNEPKRGSFSWHATHGGHTAMNFEKNKIHFLNEVTKEMQQSRSIAFSRYQKK